MKMFLMILGAFILGTLCGFTLCAVLTAGKDDK